MTVARLLRLFCAFSFLLPCKHLMALQVQVVQTASAPSPAATCVIDFSLPGGCPTMADSLTISFAPTSVGTQLLLIYAGNPNVNSTHRQCTDNSGQVWTSLGSNGGTSISQEEYFVPSHNPPGLTSVTCVGPNQIPVSNENALIFLEVRGALGSLLLNIKDAGNVSPVICSDVPPPSNGLAVDILQASTAFAPQLTFTPNQPADNILSFSDDFTFICPPTVCFFKGPPPFTGHFSSETIILATQVFTVRPGVSSGLPSFSFDSSVFNAKEACASVPFVATGVVDPVPDLMYGPKVVSANDQVGQIAGADFLATLGRPVKGIAADGVTQLVVRIPAANVGDAFTFTVLDAGGQPSVHPSEDGTLGNPGDSSPSIIQSQISTFAVSTASGPFAFAVYRAPLDFPRAGAVDENARSRTISIEAIGNGTSQDFPITIVRPPVVLIHGLWSNWESWNNFSPLVTGKNSVDPRFSVLRANYDTLIGPGLAAVSPAISVDKLQTVRANSMGYRFNAGNVLSQMSWWLQSFRSGTNPANIPVAAAQFDVVAHSMGGNIARTMPLDPNFLNNSNFGRGAIHKAISIDTPHLGSAVASLFLAPENSCLRNKVFARTGKFAITSATFQNFPVPLPGAVGDLSLGSDALQAIQGLNPNPSTPPVPTATIAGEYTNWSSLDANPNTGSATAFFVVCHSDALRQSLTSTGWPALFAVTGDARNDGMVSVTSELAGLGDDAGFHTPGFVHSADMTGFWGLGFTPPGVLDANTAISSLVLQILNTAIPEVPTFKNLGPASQ